MTKHQKNAVNFLLKYPDEWHTYNDDKLTVEVVCALVNLGIAEINQYQQFKLKSAIKANQLLNNHG